MLDKKDQRCCNTMMDCISRHYCLLRKVRKNTQFSVSQLSVIAQFAQALFVLGVLFPTILYLWSHTIGHDDDLGRRKIVTYPANTFLNEVSDRVPRDRRCRNEYRYIFI